MVFLEDYDMRVARQLVQGVDVWLNNPRRPYEASGTSGMKVIPNGGLNLSVLDGWWDEAYEPGLGWAIGDRSEVGEPGHQDWLDSQSLYSVLEHEVTPMFYHRLEDGVPRGWVQMIKRSIRQMAPHFSTGRMVREYTERFYMPSSETYGRMAAEGLARARAALEWRERVRTNWALVRVASVGDDASVSNAVGKEVHVRALVDLGHLAPEEVRVQAVVGKVGAAGDLLDRRVEDLRPVGDEAGSRAFEGTIVCSVPGGQGYSVRVIPHHPDVRVPSELGLVAWE